MWPGGRGTLLAPNLGSPKIGALRGVDLGGRLVWEARPRSDMVPCEANPNVPSVMKCWYIATKETPLFFLGLSQRCRSSHRGRGTHHPTR